MKLICINDSDRPNDIPTSKWIKKGNHYTAVKFNKMNMQAGALGVQLEEIEITDDDLYWIITLSYTDSTDWSGLTRRTYKTLKIGKDSGEFRAIKIRSIK